MSKKILVNNKKHRDQIAEKYGQDNLLLIGDTQSTFIFIIKDKEEMKIYMNKNLFGDIDKVVA